MTSFPRRLVQTNTGLLVSSRGGGKWEWLYIREYKGRSATVLPTTGRRNRESHGLRLRDAEGDRVEGRRGWKVVYRVDRPGVPTRIDMQNL